VAAGAGETARAQRAGSKDDILAVLISNLKGKATPMSDLFAKTG
jgi:hypothetical protein